MLMPRVLPWREVGHAFAKKFLAELREYGGGGGNRTPVRKSPQ
jgi:hypothetical protein